MPIDFQAARNTMVEQQVRPWEVLDPRVLEEVYGVAMERLDREGRPPVVVPLPPGLNAPARTPSDP